MALAPQVEFLSLIRSIKELVKNVRVIFIFMFENSSIKRSRLPNEDGYHNITDNTI